MAKTGKDKDGTYWYKYLANAKRDPTLASTLLRGFAKVKCGESQVLFLIKALQKLGASLEVVSKRVKSNHRAQELRNLGNSLFTSDADAARVFEMYTQSISYALPGSRELALAYANRSAVSFEKKNYEECLIDIGRSLENDYPNEMQAKLYARRVRCLMALKRSQGEVENALNDTRKALSKMSEKASGRCMVVKTLADKNHMTPRDNTKVLSFAEKPTKVKSTVEDDNCEILGATGIKIQYSNKYGRHLIATRDIRPGEIIAIFDNYANARSPEKCYRECAKCTKATNVGIPCDNCVNVIYCSTSCRDEAWKDYHETECPILGVMLDLDAPPKTLLSMRITLKALQETGSVGELKKTVKNIDSISDPRVTGFTGNVFDCSKYASIYSLTSHSGKPQKCHDYCLSLISAFAVYYLATRTEIFGRKYDADLRIFDENASLGFIAGLMIRNGAIIHGSGTEDFFVAPFIALCNHSCSTNAVILSGSRSIALAVEPIKAGDQIWNNYLGLKYSRVPKAERQQSLRKEYNFTCDCVACAKNWPMFDQLPSFRTMPEMSPRTRDLVWNAVTTYSLKAIVAQFHGKFMEIKADLVKALELLFEHAGPCQELVTYKDELAIIVCLSLDIFSYTVKFGQRIDAI
ncbi:SET and MYND domain-containing protein 4 isoform X2 [Diachasma alloeum]|uniref:SET and MYND domain-containing protein 4 isoform X2 n=1 Tax=Diachasma alloeum TaxID=454923 RepID=UPI0007382AD4|nr:SET and MYND domain-containing protein 4 isoform X2 [Diachasma alloeum]